MTNTLVIGRCWKFLDFLIPSVDSVVDYNDADLIVVDVLSSRSSNIASYCKRMLKANVLKGFISSDANYFGNIWHVNKYLIDIFKRYEYVCMTDLDLKLVTPEQNWLGRLSGLLAKHDWIGAVSADFEKLPGVQNDYPFSFVKDHPEAKLGDDKFWNMLTDGWFYMVRSKELVSFIESNGRLGQFGPGMHGYNQYCMDINKAFGRTDLTFYHYGWLRCEKEWNEAYKETGINFDPKTVSDDGQKFLGLQGNWHGSIKIPNRSSFRMEIL